MSSPAEVVIPDNGASGLDPVWAQGWWRSWPGAELIGFIRLSHRPESRCRRTGIRWWLSKEKGVIHLFLFFLPFPFFKPA